MKDTYSEKKEQDLKRINVASPRTIIEECMNRIKCAFEGL